MQKNTKKANRTTRCEQLGVRTGIKSGVSDCCNAYCETYPSENCTNMCPPDDVCKYIPVTP